MSFYDFLKTLFDDGEHTCFSANTPDKGPLATAVIPVYFEEMTDDDIERYQWESHGPAEFFVINPLSQRTKRADANVTVFRNMLVEIDSIPLAEQLSLIKDIGMPYSTCTYSGGKSYHFIISLKTPSIDKESYVRLVKRVYAALEKVAGTKVADPSCHNPSRFSRLPCAYRVNKAKVQELVYVGERSDGILDWVDKVLGKDLGPKQPRLPIAPCLAVSDASILAHYLYPATKNFLRYGAQKGERHNSIFKSSCDAARCRIPAQTWIDWVESIRGLELEGDKHLRTIADAYRYADEASEKVAP